MRAAIAREYKEAWTTGDHRGGDADYRSGKTRVLRFLSDFQKMTIDERDIRNIIADTEATNRRLRETIRVRELAATHRLGQMRRLLMLEEQNAWKRKAGFDYI